MLTDSLKGSFNYFLLFLLVNLIHSPTFSQDNLVKIAPFKMVPILAPSAAQISYERIVAKKASVGIITKFFFGKNMTGYEGSFENDEGEMPHGIFNSGTFKGFTLTTEYRYYTNKTGAAPNGFYLAPYLRYLRYNLTGVFDYNPDNGEENSLLDGVTKVSGIGAGFGIGSQKIWDSGFLIDWNVGIGVAIMGGTMVATVEGPLNDDIPEFVQDLANTLAKIPLVNPTLTNKGDHLDAEASGLPWPIIKTQLAIGYAF